MKVTIGDKVLNFGIKGRIKWGSIFDPVLQVYFRNGKTLALDPSVLPEDVRQAAMRHGLKQRMHDACNQNDTPEEDQATIEGIWDGLLKSWKGGDSSSGLRLLAQAIAEIQGKTPEEVMDRLKELKPAELKSIRANRRVKEVLERLELEGVEAMDDDELDNLF